MGSYFSVSVMRMKADGGAMADLCQRDGKETTASPEKAKPKTLGPRKEGPEDSAVRLREIRLNPGMVETIARLEEECDAADDLIADDDESPGEKITLPPDDAYISNCYDRILALREEYETKTTLVDRHVGRYETQDAIFEIFTEMADKAQKEGGSYSAMVVSLLIKHWTRMEGDMSSYDKHMGDHVDAIEVLAKAWMKDRSFGGRRFKILEASCGTGTALEAFLDSMPPKVLRKLRVVANDVSSASLEEAKKRLAKYEGKVRIEFTQHDLTQSLPPGRFDLIIMSQTLPFICDEQALRDQRLGLALPSETRHITAKRKLLETLIRKKLKPGKGEFLLIDEHPMKLSLEPFDFNSIVDFALFNETFRVISRGTLINDVLKRIEEARFRGHIETFIDRNHSMYLMAMSAMKPGKAPPARPPGKDAAEAEGEDVWRVIRRMEHVHASLIDRLQGFEDGGSTAYKPIGVGEKRLVIDKGYYEEMISGRPGYWRTNGSYNLVVISGLMHHIGKDEYRCIIDKLKRSHKLEPGAAILFVDEWPAPAGMERPVGNSDARTFIFNDYDDHVFCGSVRSGNKYGYLYVVRKL